MTAVKKENFFFQHNINHFKAGDYSRYIRKNGISGLGFINQINSYLTENNNEGSFYHFVDYSFNLTPHDKLDSSDSERAYWRQLFIGCPEIIIEKAENEDFKFSSDYVEVEVINKKKESSRYGSVGNIVKQFKNENYKSVSSQLRKKGYKISPEVLVMIANNSASREQLDNDAQIAMDFLTENITNLKN